jgi:hypothetical protein
MIRSPRKKLTSLVPASSGAQPGDSGGWPSGLAARGRGWSVAAKEQAVPRPVRLMDQWRHDSLDQADRADGQPNAKSAKEQRPGSAAFSF